MEIGRFRTRFVHFNSMIQNEFLDMCIRNIFGISVIAYIDISRPYYYQSQGP